LASDLEKGTLPVGQKIVSDEGRFVLQQNIPWFSDVSLRWQVRLTLKYLVD